ncbi:MAG TPA: glycosyltransferase family 39 protein [Stellaceae bacterium]|nr:glycosyltransferase family 39 protein [Stellaceae bacterium]
MQRAGRGTVTAPKQAVARLAASTYRRWRVEAAPSEKPALSWWCAGTIGSLALAVRLYGLGDKPFWLDEVATLHRVTTSLPDVISSSLHADHYPSYFLLMWLVAKLGASQWLLRLPSAIFGAVAASLTAMIGRSLADWRSGLVAGLLMALSPFEVQFGQEARSYTLVSCLILIALWGLVRLAQAPDAAAAAFRVPGPQRAAWLTYGLGTVAALDVLNVAVPWLVAANIGAIAIGRAAGRQQASFWRNWALAHLGIAAGWLPMVAAVYVARKGAVIDDVGWAWPATEQTIWSIVGPVYLLRISNFITTGTAPATVPALSLAIVALVATGIWRLRRNPPALAIVGVATFVLPLSLALTSLFVPVLVPRYFVWGAAPFFVLAGAGLGQLSGPRFTMAAIGVAGACLLALSPYYGYETKPRWDLAARQLATLARPGDTVLVNSYYAYWLLSAFAAGAGLDEHKVTVTWEFSKVVPPLPGHTLWAVYGRTGPAVAISQEEFETKFASLGPQPPGRRLGRYITLWAYPGLNAEASFGR